MAGQLRVKSVERLRDFVGRLAIFHDEARDAVATLDRELAKFLRWLEEDRVQYWRSQVKRWRKEFEIARSDMSRKRLGQVRGTPKDLIEEKKRLKRAEDKLERAESKLRIIGRLMREVERVAIDFKSSSRNMSRHLEGDPPPALHRFKQIVTSLEEYLAVSSSGRPAQSTTPADAETESSMDEGDNRIDLDEQVDSSPNQDDDVEPETSAS